MAFTAGGDSDTEADAGWASAVLLAGQGDGQVERDAVPSFSRLASINPHFEGGFVDVYIHLTVY